MAKKNSYKWTFQNIGGSTRVKIQSGEDLRHLGELDPKMWTVLSCPTQGLEIDSKSLQYIDVNKDERIHIEDIVASANWLTDVVTSVDTILQNNGLLALSNINQKSENGAKLYNSARQILANLGKPDATEISVADTSDSIKIFEQTLFNGDGVIIPESTDEAQLKDAIIAIIATLGSVKDRSGKDGINAEQIETFFTALADYKAWQEAQPALPFGEQTDAVMSAWEALNPKIQDFFMRNSLASFSTESKAALDVQTAQIEAISADNLTDKLTDIAAYPIARITGATALDLKAPLNPVWAAQFSIIRDCALDAKATELTLEQWNSIGAQFADYKAWLDAKKGDVVAQLTAEQRATFNSDDVKGALLELVEKDKALEAEANSIADVDRLTHLYRDFATLLNNFITLQDFYNPDKDVLAIFQAGRLVIDQRICNLCLRVANAGNHATMAPASGMYLIYCDCKAKGQPAPIQIVAAMTAGDTGDLYVGKNAIFYDRNGLDWDATITKIIDNPISIRQAFYSPYKKFVKWIEDTINKRAAEKDAKVFEDATAKANTIATDGAEGAKAQVGTFDIAKFAGIFAAIGMAVGLICDFLLGLIDKMTESVWTFVGAIAVIILLISGPSMIMAWLKLRKRNLAPILNANGWAVNAGTIVNIPFGNSLTDLVKFPIVKGQDPFKKQVPLWRKCLYWLFLIAALCGGLWLCNGLKWAGAPSPLSCFNKAEQTVVADDAQAPEVADQSEVNDTPDE